MALADSKREGWIFIIVMKARVCHVGEGRQTNMDSMTVKLIGKLLEKSWFFRLSNTHHPPSALSLSLSIFPLT